LKKIVLTTAVAVSLSIGANADFLGLEAGYASWSSSLTGTVKGSNIIDTEIDLENDLGYDEEINDFFWVYIDHPLPFLPNIKVQKTDYTTSSSTINTITYDGKTYSGKINSSLTLDQIDLITYYRILDNWVNLDLGLNFKFIDGNIKFSDSIGSVRDTDKDFSAVVPMLYAKARFDMPFSGLSVEADCSYVSYDGSKFTDMKAGAVYQSSIGLGVMLGYRSEKVVLDDIDDVNTDITISGPYAGLFYHF